MKAFFVFTWKSSIKNKIKIYGKTGIYTLF